MASRDDFPFGRFWNLPVSESNIATTPKGLHQPACDPGCIGKGYRKQLWSYRVNMARDLGYWELFLTADPHTEHFYARWGALRIGEKTCPAFSGRKLPVMGVFTR